MISERLSGSAHRCAQLGGGRTERPHAFGGVVGVLDDAELLAVRVQFVDQMRHDLDLAAVEIELPSAHRSAVR